MDWSDVPKIRRQLRQLRARLLPLLHHTDAVLAQAQSVSNSHSSRSSRSPPPPPHLVPHPTHSPHSTFLDLRRPAPPTKVTVRYGRSAAARRAASAGALSQPPPAQPQCPLARCVALDPVASAESPTARRQRLAFQEYFDDLADRVWSVVRAGDRASAGAAVAGDKAALSDAGDTNRPHGPTCPPLTRLAAFAVARNLPLVTTDLLPSSSAETSPTTTTSSTPAADEIDIEEQWYDYIPACYRRAVLWAHICELCKTLVPSPAAQAWMVETCMRVGARGQAWEVLCGLWDKPAVARGVYTAWAFGVAERMGRMDAWVRVYGRGMTVDACENGAGGDGDIGAVLARGVTAVTAAPRVASERLQGVLTAYALIAHLQRRDTHRNDDATTWPAAWVRRVLSHSCLTCDAPYTCPCATALLLACVHSHARAESQQAPLALPILLRGSQLVSPQQQQQHVRRPKWLTALAHANPCPDTLDAVLEFYPTFSALAALQTHARNSIPAPAIAQNLAALVVNHYDAIAAATRVRGGACVGIEEVRRVMAGGGGCEQSSSQQQWRYEPIIQTWVARTPRAAAAAAGAAPAAEEDKSPACRAAAAPRTTRSSTMLLPPRAERTFYLESPRRTKPRPTPFITPARPTTRGGAGALGLKRFRVVDDCEDLAFAQDGPAAITRRRRVATAAAPRPGLAVVERVESDEDEEDAWGRLEMSVGEALPLTQEADELVV